MQAKDFINIFTRAKSLHTPFLVALTQLLGVATKHTQVISKQTNLDDPRSSSSHSHYLTESQPTHPFSFVTRRTNNQKHNQRP